MPLCPPPPPHKPRIGRGPYVGAYVGGAYNLTTFMGGVLAGYQYQTGSFVIGAEGDAFMDNAGDYGIFAKLRAGVGRVKT